MRTKRLISTIGYNSPGFLSATLSRLCDAGVVEWAHYIKHTPEEDEEKAHWHIVLMPSKAVDTRALQREFEEFDIDNPSKPLGTLPWRFSSSLDDWLLYAIHDAGYLASKGQVRKFHYRRQDVFSTCPELLSEQWSEINLAKYGLGQMIAEAVEQNIPWERLVASGMIPPAHWTFWREVYFGIRGGGAPSPLRKELSHTPKRPRKSQEQISAEFDGDDAIALSEEYDLQAAIAAFEKSQGSL